MRANERVAMKSTSTAPKPFPLRGGGGGDVVFSRNAIVWVTLTVPMRDDSVTKRCSNDFEPGLVPRFHEGSSTRGVRPVLRPRSRRRKASRSWGGGQLHGDGNVDVHRDSTARSFLKRRR